VIETGAEKIVMPRFVLLFRSHPIPQNQGLEGIPNRSEIARKPPMGRPLTCPPELVNQVESSGC
jgi:hypothetical protein